MRVAYVRLLVIQRELYRIPRGRERFEAYLKVMTNTERDDLTLAPLAGMNPMGKDHIPALLDEYLALDAEGIAARAVEEAAGRLAEAALERKIGLVIVDDLMGGWTNRYTTEFGLCFVGRAVATSSAAQEPAAPAKRREYREWLSAVLWTSEAPSEKRVREAAQLPIYRAAYMERHGPPISLGGLLAQEGAVTAAAGCMEPALEAGDLAYTREVLGPLLGAEDWPTIMAGAFGDGHTPGTIPAEPGPPPTDRVRVALQRHANVDAAKSAKPK